MPLWHGKTAKGKQRAFRHNLRVESRTKRSRAQQIAIAAKAAGLSSKRRR